MRLAFLILSIIVLLDILAALSALLGLADFLDSADLLSKIVLKDEEKGNSPDDDTEDQRHKNLKLSGQQLFTRKNFPDEARKYASRDI